MLFNKTDQNDHSLRGLFFLSPFIVMFWYLAIRMALKVMS